VRGDIGAKDLLRPAERIPIVWVGRPTAVLPPLRLRRAVPAESRGIPAFQLSERAVVSNQRGKNVPFDR
jgi:hypothetical protein